MPNAPARHRPVVRLGDAVLGPTVLLRADLDALPLDDPKDVPYHSTVPGVCHACGHDVHTAILVGAALALAEVARRDGLPGGCGWSSSRPRSSCPAGPAMWSTPASSRRRHARSRCTATRRSRWAGSGCAAGPITAASDMITVQLTGPGGHTSRPHNTVDLVYALGHLLTDLPAALTRMVDPRAVVTLVWGGQRRVRGECDPAARHGARHRTGARS